MTSVHEDDEVMPHHVPCAMRQKSCAMRQSSCAMHHAPHLAICVASVCDTEPHCEGVT